MNKICVTGNITRDFELRKTTKGVSVATFTVADNKRRGDGANFFRVTVWRGLAENCARYLGKGSNVTVFGTVNIREYEQNGENRVSVDVDADEVEFGAKGSKEESFTPPGTEVFDEDDIFGGF